MSVRTMATVWEKSRHSGSELLMLLAIADFADDNGRAYPSITTLATKCRTKQRYAIKLLDALSASGELEIRRQQGPMGRGGRTNLYRVQLDRLGARPAEVVNKGSPVNSGAVVHQGAGSSEPGFREVVNQSAPKPSGTIRTTKGARKRAAGFDAGAIELPQWLDRAAWMAWVADRRDRRKPITRLAAEKQLAALAKLRDAGHSPGDVIDQSISNGWSGLFEVKDKAASTRGVVRRPALDCDEVIE